MLLLSSPAVGAGPRSTTCGTPRDGSRAPTRAKHPDGVSRDRVSLLRFLRRRLPTVFLLFLLVLVLGVSGGRAASVLKVTFSQVVDRAELIAVGTVSAIEDRWDAERGLPFIHVTFSDIEILKGTAPGGELTLQFLGGLEPGGLRLTISGMPRFTVKQRAVVFSAGNGVYACPLVGWWQGLYRVVFDHERNDLIVADHGGRHVVAFDGAVGRRDARVSSAVGKPAADALTLAADALTLAEFKGLIAEELR